MDGLVLVIGLDDLAEHILILRIIKISIWNWFGWMSHIEKKSCAKAGGALGPSDLAKHTRILRVIKISIFFVRIKIYIWNWLGGWATLKKKESFKCPKSFFL